MGVIPEDAGDPDDIFAAMTENLTLEDPGMISSPANWTNHELMKRWTKVKQELRELHEMHHQVTQRGRELQSEYQAIWFIMKERNLL